MDILLLILIVKKLLERFTRKKLHQTTNQTEFDRKSFIEKVT